MKNISFYHEGEAIILQQEHSGCFYEYVLSENQLYSHSTISGSIKSSIPFEEIVKTYAGRLPLLQNFLFHREYWLTGSDPEIFAFTASGKPIPAWQFLPKTTTLPNGAIWDGVQAEIHPEPKRCHEQVIDNIRSGLVKVWTALRVYDSTAVLECKDVVKIPLELRRTASDEQILLGCAPSSNAYGIEPIDILDSRKHVYRYSGVHTHHSIQAGSGDTKPPWWPDGTVVAMDKICGLVLTALGRELEDPLRRKAYGRPGEYRLPRDNNNNIRLEYRTPGAFLMQRPEIFHLGLEFARTGFLLGLKVDGRIDLPIPDVKDIIMNCDADAAVKVIKQHEPFFANMIRRYAKPDKTLDVIYRGLKATGLLGTTVDKNWLLESTWSSNSNDGCNEWGQLVGRNSS